MKINFLANLLGFKEGISKKDNKAYYILNFSDDDGQTMQCMTNNPNLFVGFERLALCKAECNLFIGKDYTRLTLLSLSAVPFGD